VAVKEGTKRRKITKREAIITQLVNKSAGADFRAMRILLDLLREYNRQLHGLEGTSSTPTDDSEADNDVVQELIARLRSATVPDNEE
jgi:hypothetical protein